MTYYIRNGNSFSVTDEGAIDIHNHLPAGVYIIKVQPITEILYLEKVDSFQTPDKVYGDLQQIAARVLNTFEQRTSATGVLLSGEKGSGKTMLAKLISSFAALKDIPTIVINQPLVGDEFNQFIQNIHQECVILFDEFEKVYDRNKQQHVLTLLDGVFPSKKLFILTINDVYQIDNHMRNRPGRLYYSIDFTGLESDFIKDYCQENLKNKKHTNDICKLASLFGAFNFDMLKTLVEEMNRYGESPTQALKYLNTKPEADQSGSYSFTVKNEHGQDMKPTYGNTINGSPLQQDKHAVEFDVGDKEVNYVWLQSDLLELNARTGEFVYRNRDGQVIKFSRNVDQRPLYYSLLA